MRHDFTTDEFVLEIGAKFGVRNSPHLRRNNALDDASSLGRLGALPDGPSPNFVRTTGKVPNQLHPTTLVRHNTRRWKLTYIKAGITSLSDFSKGTLGTFLLSFCFLLVAKCRQSLFERDRERYQSIARITGINPSLYFW